MAGRKLDSWKEIAQYLGRDVTTAIRWEKERALPVRRIPGGRRQGVFAFSDEIDAWLNGARAAAPHYPPEPLGGEQKTHDSVPSDDPETTPKWARTEQLSVPSNGELAPVRRRYARGLGVAAGAIAVLSAIGGATLALRPHPAVHAKFNGDTLVAWDAAGGVAWTHDYGRAGLEVVAEMNSVQSRRLRSRVHFVDLDGDRQPEILVLRTHRRIARDPWFQEGIDCFSRTGKLLWQYEPRLNLSFGGRRFEGQWSLLDLLLPAEGGPNHVWLSLASAPWWPTVLVTLDRDGVPAVRFVNSGVLYALHYHPAGLEGSLILAGGINNGYRAPALAVLLEHGEPATSPQEPGAYKCDECPSGLPPRYYVFPRSELNEVGGEAQGRIENIVQLGSQIELWSFESPGANRHFLFSRDLEPESMSMGDGYWVVHNRAEKEGKLEHSIETCPELTPASIRRWTPEEGWTPARVQVTRPPSVLTTPPGASSSTSQPGVSGGQETRESDVWSRPERSAASFSATSGLNLAAR